MDFGGCVVRLADGTLARAQATGKLMGHRKALGNAVVVGDQVDLEAVLAASGEYGVWQVTAVSTRRNAYSRRATGRRGVEQVVAANLDQVVHVSAIEDPPFSPGLADRVLCQAEHAGIPARLVVNKIDLGDRDRSAAASILGDYARAGYAGHAVSGKSGEGLEDLLAACRGRRTLFVGHSGVGKSTLLNAMVPGLDLLAGRVNPKTGKGRHTTSAAWLLCPAPDLELVDTPGVRAFGLWGIGPDDLDQAYPEFRPFLSGCRFADCSHGNEPGCAILEAVREGHIAPRRHESFLKLRAELRQDLAATPYRDAGR